MYVWNSIFKAMDLLRTLQVVYVNRNPKDTLVSFYHHHRISKFLGMQTLNSWHEFYAMFMAGERSEFFFVFII